MVCIVAPAPGMPGVPRLSLTLLSESAPRRAPGDMAVARYVVKNNDPSNSVSLGAIAGARQSAFRPQGANERQGAAPVEFLFGEFFGLWGRLRSGMRLPWRGAGRAEGAHGTNGANAAGGTGRDGGAHATQPL